MPNYDLASGSHDKTIRIWSLATRTVKSNLTAHSGAVLALALLRTGELVSGDATGQVFIWNSADWSVKLSIYALNQVNALTILSSNDLVTGSQDGNVRVWNAVNAVLKQTIKTGDQPVKALVSLSNGYLATGLAGKTDNLKIWQ